ncbi:hypothetical protein MTO96_004626 [Rhipicephalus appendiculatus]
METVIGVQGTGPRSARGTVHVVDEAAKAPPMRGARHSGRGSRHGASESERHEDSVHKASRPARPSCLKSNERIRKEGEHTGQTGGEQTPSQHQREAASVDAPPSDTSSPTSSSSWSHNTPASSPTTPSTTSEEGSSPEQVEKQPSHSPSASDVITTSSAAASSSPSPPAGAQRVSPPPPATPPSRAAPLLSQDGKQTSTQQQKPRPFARSSCVLGSLSEQLKGSKATTRPPSSD